MRPCEPPAPGVDVNPNLCLSAIWVVPEGTAEPRLPSIEERHSPAPRWEFSGWSEPEAERKRNQEPGPRHGWGDIQGAGWAPSVPAWSPRSIEG